VFFTICAYVELLGLRTAPQDHPGATQTPLHMLAAAAELPFFGRLLDICVLVSLFSGGLACVTAGSRILLVMGHKGLAPESLRRTHPTHRTPHLGIATVGVAALASVAILAASHESGLDVYGLMAALATYGFLVAYALVAIAFWLYLRRQRPSYVGLGFVPALAFFAIFLVLVGNLSLASDTAYGRLLCIFLAYLVLGLVVWPRLRGSRVLVRDRE
jgi:amino acid transporter